MEATARLVSDDSQRRSEIQEKYGDVGVEAYDALERFLVKTEAWPLNYYYDLGVPFVNAAKRLPATMTTADVFEDIASQSYSVVCLAIQMAELFTEDEVVSLVAMRSKPQVAGDGGVVQPQRLSWGIVKAIIPLGDKDKIKAALDAWVERSFSTRAMGEWVTDTFGMAVGGKHGARDAKLAGAPVSQLKALASQSDKVVKVMDAATAALVELKGRTSEFTEPSYRLACGVEARLAALVEAVPKVLVEVRDLLAAVRDVNPTLAEDVKQVASKVDGKSDRPKRGPGRPRRTDGADATAKPGRSSSAGGKAKTRKRKEVSHVDDKSPMERHDQAANGVASIGGPLKMRQPLTI